MGFIVAAWLVGLLAERGWDRHPSRTALAMMAGNVVIYLFGASWLAAFVGPQAAWVKGVLPFLVGDVVKIALATAGLPLAWRVVDNWEAGP